MQYNEIDIEEVNISFTFSPKNLFKESITRNIGDFEVNFAQGAGTIQIKTGDVKAFLQNRTILDDLHKKLEVFFKTASIITKKEYQLSKFNVEKVLKDGRRVKELSTIIEAVLVTEDVHIQITDQTGKIVGDSKASELDEISKYTELCLKIYDANPLVKHLIDFYMESINKTDRVLSALYDLYDALIKEFGDRKKINNNLGVSIKKQNRLRIITNDPLLKQGRHSGKNTSQLRDATNKEINEARDIAKALLLNYLLFLDNNP